MLNLLLFIFFPFFVLLGFVVFLQWQKRDPLRLDPRSALMFQGGHVPSAQVPNNCINILMYFPRLPTSEQVIEWMQQRLIEKYVEFRATPKRVWDGYVWEEIPTAAKDHLFETEVTSEDELNAAVEHIVRRNIAQYPQRLWEVHCVRNQGEGSSAIVLRVEHCIGDGMSLSGVFLNLFTDADGHPVMGPQLKRRPLPAIKRCAVMQLLTSGWDILCSLCHAHQVVHGKFDSETPLGRGSKQPPIFNPHQKIVMIPPHSLDLIQRINEKTGATTNDVVFACTTGAIHRYLQICDLDPTNLCLRALVAMAFPSDLPDGKLANTWTMVSVPFPVDMSTPDSRLRESMAAWHKVKASSFAALMMLITSGMIAALPLSFQRKTATGVMARHSMMMSNVAGFPSCVYLCGIPLEAVRMVYVNLVPQFGLVSYNGKLFGNFTVDPAMIPNAHLLSDLYMQELHDLAQRYGLE